jgi:hypothetical protein
MLGVKNRCRAANHDGPRNELLQVRSGLHQCNKLRVSIVDFRRVSGNKTR